MNVLVEMTIVLLARRELEAYDKEVIGVNVERLEEKATEKANRYETEDDNVETHNDAEVAIVGFEMGEFATAVKMGVDFLELLPV